jgi:hypothetical protein
VPVVISSNMYLVTLLLVLLICTVTPLEPHPRLILNPARATAVSALVNSTDPFAIEFTARCLAQANYLAKVSSSVENDDERLLLGDPNGRQMIQGIYSLCVGALIAPSPTLATEYRVAAKQILMKVAASTEFDPNGTVMLNTGEILHGLGLGFDWLYQDLNTTERASVVSAIVKTGLSKVKAALSTTPPDWAKAFVSTYSNWNTVILGGSIIAALSVQGEPGAPQWLDQVLDSAISDLKIWSANAWGPDGAWPEGLNYGSYSERYLVPTIASLLTATGDDSGLLSLPGVLKGPRFISAGLVPTHPYLTQYDYFDARVLPETIVSWLAMAAWANDAPAAAAIKNALMQVAPFILPNETETMAMNAPLSLIYYTTLGQPGDELSLPLVERFHTVELVTSRSSRTDENATFIAFKGLNTSGNWAHTHLDQGSFVFATHGQWFAQDLGSDQYSAPGYFSPGRFKLLRTNISGHNTLSFSGMNPHCVVLDTYKSDCSPAFITLYNDTTTMMTMPAMLPGTFPIDLFAIVNLTEGLLDINSRIRRVERGFIIGSNRTQIITVDEVDLAVTANTVSSVPPLWWTIYTVANVSISADTYTATLTMWNVSVPVTVSFLSNASNCLGAFFTVSDLNLLPPLLPSPGVHVLRLTAPAETCTRIVVAMGVDPPGVGSGVRPLSDWPTYGPLH